MTKSLTPITVEKLKPAATRYEIADGGQRGLKLVIFPSGQKSFVVRYRFNGVKRKLTLGHVGLAAARKAAAAALYEVHEGKDPAAAKQAVAASTKETVRWVCEEYLRREGGKLRNASDRRRALERLVYPTLGNTPVASLRRSQVVRLLDDIQDNSGDRMADITLSYLRRALAWHAGRVDDFNSPIIAGMGRYNASERARSRTLSDDELRKIWHASATPHPFHAFVRFLLLTGCRRSEAQLLTWPEIKGSDWHLPAARNKTKEDLIRPLSSATQDLLRQVPRVAECPFVFTISGSRPISMPKPKATFNRRCGVTGWTLHDLRRTARTLLSRAGVAPDHAERCLGHVVGGVRGVYDKHAYHGEMRHAFEALASTIGQVVSPAPGGVVTRLRPRARTGKSGVKNLPFEKRIG
jgi:integrase